MLGSSLSSEASVEWSSFSAAGVEALEVERLKGELERVSQGSRLRLEGEVVEEEEEEEEGLGLEGHRPN